MSRPRISQLAAALALAGLLPVTADAQRASLATAIVLSLADSTVPPPPALKPAYHVHLSSTWPQEAAGGCRNGGEETVDGTLARASDGTYTGTFTRRTELLFCGAHGSNQVAGTAGCELVLTGRGEVAVTGVVQVDDTRPGGREVRLVWTPAPGHQAEVNGACAPAFKNAVRQMYLETPHAAEFALPAAGAGPRTERLENYAWTVAVE